MSLIPMDGIASLVNTVVSRLWPDKTEVEKQQLQLALQESLQEFQLQQGQMQVNQAEASSGNKFASSWRPLAAYVCIVIMMFTYLIEPWTIWICKIHGVEVPPFPDMNASDMMNVLMGLLGLGAMRTVERIKKV